MASSEYSFIDIAVLDGVRTRFAAGDALAILSVDLDEVIWANGPGARLFGYPDIEAIMGASAGLAFAQKRQIAATPGFPDIGRDRPLVMRLSAGMGSRAVGFLASGVSLPDGEPAILIASPAASPMRDPRETAERAISGFMEAGYFAALVASGGTILHAASGFERLGIYPETIADLVSDVAAAPDRLVKRLIPAGRGRIPAGIARLTDDPPLHLLVVVDDAGLDWEDEEANASADDDAAVQDAPIVAGATMLEAVDSGADDEVGAVPSASLPEMEAGPLPDDDGHASAEDLPEPAGAEATDAEAVAAWGVHDEFEDEALTPGMVELRPVDGAPPANGRGQVDRWYFGDEAAIAKTIGPATDLPAAGKPDAQRAARESADAAMTSRKTPDTDPREVAPPPRNAAPVRFAWRTDASGRFSMISPEFSAAVGKAAADVIGRSFADVAALFGMDEDGAVAGLLDRRDTWSGRTVLWPIEATDLRAPVDLAALPVYGRDRRFEGFRGFGIARMADAVVDPDATGLGLGVSAPAEPEVQSPELPDEAPQAGLPLAANDAGTAGAPPMETSDAPVAPVSPPDAEDPFRGEVPVISIDTALKRRFSDKIIRLHEHRPSAPGSATAAAPAADGRTLSPGERNAFREIGERLKEVVAPAAEQAAPAPTPADATVAPEAIESPHAAAGDRAAANEEAVESNVASPRDPVEDLADAVVPAPETGDDGDFEPERFGEVLEGRPAQLADGRQGDAGVAATPLAYPVEMAPEAAEARPDPEDFIPSPEDVAARSQPFALVAEVDGDVEPRLPGLDAQEEPDTAATVDGSEPAAALAVPHDTDAEQEAFPERAADPGDVMADAPASLSEVEPAPQSFEAELAHAPVADRKRQPATTVGDLFAYVYLKPASDAPGSESAGLPASLSAPLDAPEPLAGEEDVPHIEAALGDQPLGDEDARHAIVADDRILALEESAPLSARVDEVLSPHADDDDDTAPLPEPAEDGLRTDIEAILAPLPLPLLVHSGDVLHFANDAFRALTGYASLDQLRDEGGLGAIFAEPCSDEDDTPRNRGAVLRARDGRDFPVHAHLQSIPWRGGKALLLALTPLSPPEPEPLAEPDMVQQPANDAGSPEELLARVEEMRTILDTATDGVVLIADDGTIRSINRPAEALFGYDGKDVVGRMFTSLFAVESQRAARDYLQGLSDNGVASVLNDGREVIGREAQGRFLPLFMTIGRLPGGKGFCAVMRDITQWKRAEEELTQARAIAERASSQKTDFLARVSHEIRTPLNAIIGFSELMMDEKFGPIGNDRYRDYLRDINRSGNHVLDLVNDLLDISKIEAGEQEMSYEAVSLNDTLSETVAMMQPQANRERVIIRSSLASRLPEVVADLRSIRQIALNLLSNAIRFTQPGGQVIVSTSYETSGDVVMRVRDTGVGMSSAEIEQALKPFKQINSLKRSRHDGTGLGLPLTKAMVEANRARFTINSTPSEGTLVEICFPSTRVLAD